MGIPQSAENPMDGPRKQRKCPTKNKPRTCTVVNDQEKKNYISGTHNAKHDDQLLQLIIEGRIEERRGMGKKKLSWLLNIRRKSQRQNTDEICSRKHSLVNMYNKKKKKKVLFQCLKGWFFGNKSK